MLSSLVMEIVFARNQGFTMQTLSVSEHLHIMRRRMSALDDLGAVYSDRVLTLARHAMLAMFSLRDCELR